MSTERSARRGRRRRRGPQGLCNVASHRHSLQDPPSQFGQSRHLFLNLLLTLINRQTVATPPTVKLTFTSSAEKETGLKESKIELVLSNFTYHLTADLLWLQNLSAFAKAPAGVSLAFLPSAEDSR